MLGSPRRLELQDAISKEGARYVVDFAKALGQPGLQWKHGALYFDTHPELRVRQMPGTMSPFWDLRTNPIVAGMLRRVCSTLASADYRLDKPALPAWYKDNPRAVEALERQYEYIGRVFYDWQQTSFKNFIRSAVTCTVIQGYSWFEIIAAPRVVMLGGKPHECYWPSYDAPAFRAPWSIRYWLTDREKFAGIICDFSYQSDYSGGQGPSWVTIPADKIILIRSSPLGSTDLGRSFLRDCYNELKAYRSAFQVEQLGIEVNAIGELVFKVSAGVSRDSQDRLEKYLLNRRATHAPGLVVPEGIDVERLDGQIPKMGDVIDRLTRLIAISWNQDDRVIATLGNVGSHAARASASEDSLAAMDDFLFEIISEPIQDYFKRLIKASFVEDTAAGYCFVPKLAWGKIDDRGEAYISQVSTAVGAGLLHWSDADEQVIRDMLDLTPVDQLKVQMQDKPHNKGDFVKALEEVNLESELAGAHEILADELNDRVAYFATILGDDINETLAAYRLKYTTELDNETARRIARAYMNEAGLQDEPLDLDILGDIARQFEALPVDVAGFYDTEMKALEGLGDGND